MYLCVLGYEITQAPVIELDYTKYAAYYNATLNISYYSAITYTRPPLKELR
jgi:hypothetical protein